MKKSALLLVGVLVLLAACQSGKPTGVQTSDGFPAPDQELVYHYAVKALEEQGFSPDYDLSDPVVGKIVTRWKNSLQPFSGQGYRDQATVTIRECPNQRNYWMTDTQVIRQRNDNMVQPGSLLAAEWGDEERVPDLENLINQRIEMYFLPGGLSPEFRQRHGLTPGYDPRLDSSTYPPRGR